MKRLIAFLMLCELLVMAGCNTMRGAGQDIQKDGETLEKAAEKHS